MQSHVLSTDDKQMNTKRLLGRDVKDGGEEEIVEGKA